MDVVVTLLLFVGGLYALVWLRNSIRYMRCYGYIERTIGAMEAQNVNPYVIEKFMDILEVRYGKQANKALLEQVVAAKQRGMPPSEFALYVAVMFDESIR
ncbi:MAG: hypothetical protein AAF756_15165 [Pseudomonadota bacterium]